MGGLVPVFWWVGLDLVFLVGRVASIDVSWVFFEVSTTLGSLPANRCVCVPVLLVVGMRHSAVELAGHWVELGLSVEMEISGRALAD